MTFKHISTGQKKTKQKFGLKITRECVKNFEKTCLLHHNYKVNFADFLFRDFQVNMSFHSIYFDGQMSLVFSIGI